MKESIIITGLHLDLNEELKNFVFDKAHKLFHHEHCIIRLRVELEKVASQTKSAKGGYFAKGHIELPGPTMVVQCQSDSLMKSIDELMHKLDRKLRRRSRLRKVKRHRLRGVDLQASIPKVEAA